MKAQIPLLSGCLIIIDQSFKVLMLKRSQNISFGSTYSFPGGKIEPQDAIEAQTYHQSIQESHQKFYNHSINSHYPQQLIAAIRETYEETGLLFNKYPSNLTYEESLNDFHQYTPLIRLITPYHIKNRFDTQFFVTHIKNGYNESGKHYAINTQCKDLTNVEDIKINAESQEFRWATPQDFLESSARGEILISFPIMMVLLILNQLQQKLEFFIDYRQNENEFIRNSLTYPYMLQFSKREPLRYEFNAFPDKQFSIDLIKSKEQPSQMLNTILYYDQLIQKSSDMQFQAYGITNNNMTNFFANISPDLQQTPFGVLSQKLSTFGEIKVKL